MKKFLFLSGIAALLIGTLSADEEAAEVVYAEKSAPQPSSQALVEQARDAYLRNNGLSLGAIGNPNNAYIGWGYSSISVDINNPAWARARVAAFDNALIDARAKFVSFQRGTILTESTRTLFEDDSYNMPMETPDQEQATRGRIRAMFSKLLAVGDEMLNRKLIDMGLDPEDFNPPPGISREDHYTNKLINKSVTQSFGSLAGLLPIQTFEGRDGQGGYGIGVLVVYSPSFRQFASDILEGRGKVQTRRVLSPLAEQLGSDAAVFASQMGVRRLYDETGMPVMVSFGQYALLDRGGSQRATDRRRESAMSIARTNADAALALFVNGNLMLNSETTTGQIIEEYTLREQKRGGFVQSVENVAFISQLNEEIRQRAELTISGLTDYTTWTYHHPDSGQELVGVIRMWSPRTHQAAQDLMNFKPERDEPARQAPARQNTDAGVRQGRMPVDVTDF